MKHNESQIVIASNFEDHNRYLTAICLKIKTIQRSKINLLSFPAPSLIARTLSSSLYTIFRTALVRFNTLLCCHDFAQLKFDDVLTTIELATR